MPKASSKPASSRRQRTPRRTAPAGERRQQLIAAAIRSIAKFLDIAVDEKAFPKIVEHCTFDYMKAHAEKSAPLGGAVWEGGAGTFINKGTNGRWKDTLTADESRAYEAKALAELGPECAGWLAHGHGHHG